SDAELFTDSIDGNSFATAGPSDYTHMNSLALDPSDRNLIVSLRHTNSIVKIDRATGATLWTLGGASDDFALTSDQPISHQHHVRPEADGSLLIFDNGNFEHQTRVISFGLDQAARRVMSFAVIYERPADQPASEYMGSAFFMGGDRYLIGWGGWTAAPRGPSV